MKPSELKEDQWIKIVPIEHPEYDPQDHPPMSGAIGFHHYYGTITMFSINRDDPADDLRGIMIMDNHNNIVDNAAEVMDKIYDGWAAMPKHARITHSG